MGKTYYQKQQTSDTHKMKLFKSKPLLILLVFNLCLCTIAQRRSGIKCHENCETCYGRSEHQCIKCRVYATMVDGTCEYQCADHIKPALCQNLHEFCDVKLVNRACCTTCNQQITTRPITTKPITTRPVTISSKLVNDQAC